VGHDPRQLGFKVARWTRAMVAELLGRQFGVRLSAASVGSCVKDRGISLLSIIEIPHPVSIRVADYWVMVGGTSSVMRSATATGSSQCGQAPPRPTRWQNTPQSGQRCSPR
jgi:Winged helix-turn helix